MPLIPSNMNPFTAGGGSGGSGGNNNSQDWSSKLLGKKIGDNHNETNFAKKDLPQKHRVVEEGGMMTMDHQPDRMNVHVDKEGIVKKVTHG